MKIISLMNEKGGSGKSTIATNLAAALHREGKKVILVDADPQGTARDWREASPEGTNLPPVIALDRASMLDSIKSMNADFVIIDTPAKAGDIAAGVVRISNVALVVIQPSGADVWASAATVKLLRQKIDVGGQIDAAFLVNRVSGQTKLSKEIKDGNWNEYGLEQLSTTIGNRVAFAQAISDGLSVYDLNDATAKAEIDAVLSEMRGARWL